MWRETTLPERFVDRTFRTFRTSPKVKRLWKMSRIAALLNSTFPFFASAASTFQKVCPRTRSLRDVTKGQGLITLNQVSAALPAETRGLFWFPFKTSGRTGRSSVAIFVVSQNCFIFFFQHAANKVLTLQFSADLQGFSTSVGCRHG